MSEAIATLAPAGAGRFEDWIWPSRATAAGAAAITPACTGRNRVGDILGATAAIGGGATAPVADVRLGVPSVRMFCDAVNGVSFQFYPPMGIFFKSTKSAVNPIDDDIAVTRIVWTFCGSGIAPGAGLDMGLEISQLGGAAAAKRILVDATNGFGWRLADANVLQWIVRGPNGLVTLNVTAAPFDLTIWHTLDMRITSATSTDEASLTVLLDNAPVNLGVLNSSWAAGTNLPPIAQLAATVGYVPNLVCNPNPINQFWTYQLRCMRAPLAIATL